jgi:hypothetical protein
MIGFAGPQCTSPTHLPSKIQVSEEQQPEQQPKTEQPHLCTCQCQSGCVAIGTTEGAQEKKKNKFRGRESLFDMSNCHTAAAKPASLPLSAVESLYVYYLAPLVDYLATSIPPGPQCLRMRWIINFQKGATFFYVLALMYHFDCWTLGAYAYLALHGSYGFCWLLKEAVFPDPSWMRKVTVISFIADFVMVCGRSHGLRVFPICLFVYLFAQSTDCLASSVLVCPEIGCASCVDATSARVDFLACRPWNCMCFILSILPQVLGPYWIAGYIVVAHRVDVTPLRMCLCVVMHTLGVVIMMGYRVWCEHIGHREESERR